MEASFTFRTAELSDFTVELVLVAAFFAPCIAVVVEAGGLLSLPFVLKEYLGKGK